MDEADANAHMKKSLEDYLRDPLVQLALKTGAEPRILLEHAFIAGFSIGGTVAALLITEDIIKEAGANVRRDH